MWLSRFRGLFLEEQHGELLYLFDPRENPGEKMLSQSASKQLVSIGVCCEYN